MLEKEATYAKLRSEKMLERHPSLVDSYRSILFDWISEVAHECKFHRETYHLALDFIDRYLSSQSNVGKLQLQLIGTTCLFLAAKFEEIRPPTVNEFADLTDGACRPEEIVDFEVVILSAINWEITPITPNNWLNIYMQIMLNLDKENTRFDNFILPSTNGIMSSNHKRIASVIDLALLHIDSLRYPSSILSAAALYYFTDELTVRQCTGYKAQDLAECVQWLKPFVETIKDIREPVFIASCKGESNSTQMHSHIATKKLLDKVILKMETENNLIKPDQLLQQPTSLKRKGYCSTDDDCVTDSSEADSGLFSPTKPTTLMTPPRSAKKSRRARL